MKPITTKEAVANARNSLKLTPKELGTALGVTTFAVNRAEQTGEFSLTLALALECLVRRTSKPGYQRMPLEEYTARMEAKALLKPKTRREIMAGLEDDGVCLRLQNLRLEAEEEFRRSGFFAPDTLAVCERLEAAKPNERKRRWIVYFREFGRPAPLERVDIYGTARFKTHE